MLNEVQAEQKFTSFFRLGRDASLISQDIRKSTLKEARHVGPLVYVAREFRLSPVVKFNRSEIPRQ